MADFTKKIITTLEEIENLTGQAQGGGSGGRMFSSQDNLAAYQQAGKLLKEAREQIYNINNDLVDSCDNELKDGVGLTPGANPGLTSGDEPGHNDPQVNDED